MLNKIFEIWLSGAIANFFLFPLIVIPTMSWHVMDRVSRRFKAPHHTTESYLKITTEHPSWAVFGYITFVAFSWIETALLVYDFFKTLYEALVKRVPPEQRVAVISQELLRVKAGVKK